MNIKELENLLATITPGEWEWHHKVMKADGESVAGYDGLEAVGNDDVLSWRTGAWLEVTPPDAALIEMAPKLLSLLLPLAKSALQLKSHRDDINEDMSSEAKIAWDQFWETVEQLAKEINL